MRELFVDRFKRLPLRDKICTVFIPIVVIPLALLAAVTGFIVSGVNMKRARENSRDQLLLVSRQMDLIAADIEHNVSLFSINRDLQESLSEPRAEGILGDLRYRAEIAPTFCAIMNIGEYVDRSRIVSLEGRIYDTLGDRVVRSPSLFRADEYRAIEGSIGRLIWRDRRAIVGMGGPVPASALELSKIVIDPSTGRYIGVLSISIKPDALSRGFAGVGDGSGGEIFIVDGDGIVVASQRRDRLFSSVAGEPYFSHVKSAELGSRVFRADGKSVLVTSAPILAERGLEWYAVIAVPMRGVAAENGRILLAIILTGLVCACLTLVFSRRIAGSVTEPVRSLIRFTKRISEGDFDATIRVDSEDEIGTLARHFDAMVKSVKDLIVENYVEQRKKREYELSLLQSQVNPHFLYNSIENIRSLAMGGDSAGAYAVATSLGGFYKGVLSDGRDIITVAEELELNRNYLNTQKYRHRDLFEYSIEVDPAIGGCSIQKLTLQPLVENSIQHGLRGFKTRGFVRIRGRLDGALVRIEVEDDGRGMDQAFAESLLASGAAGTREGHFGLRNLDERIKLHFGPSYGIGIKTEPGLGTRVEVVLPFTAEGR